MTNFIGTEGNDTANAAISELVGFTGGSVAQLTDGVGDFFAGEAAKTSSSLPMRAT